MKTVKALTAAARRSFEKTICLFKTLDNMGYNTYNSLYEVYVLLLANYVAAVWDFGKNPAPQVGQNKICTFLLEVHKFASLASTNVEMGFTEIQYTCGKDQGSFFNGI